MRLQTVRLVAGALVVAVYAGFAATASGRALDGDLYRLDLRADHRWENIGTLVSLLVSPLPVAIAVIALLWLGCRRGRLSDGIRAAAIVATAAVSARALKAMLGAVDPFAVEAKRALGAEFYPSGHAAVAMALPLAAMVVAPEHRRTIVLCGGAWCSVYGVVIFASRSHHLSDVLGGFLLGVVLASIIGLRASSGASISARVASTAIAAFAAAVVVDCMLIVLARRAVSSAEPYAALLLASMGLSGAGLLLIAGFARLIAASAGRR